MNASCPAQLTQLIIHFGSKQALDIGGLGEKTVSQMVDKELVHDVADLFLLNQEDLLTLNRMAEKSAANLVDEIQGSKETVTLPRLIYALGIPHVGRAMADQLAFRFRTLDDLAEAPQEEIVSIEAFGDTVASAIREWFDKKTNQRLIRKLKDEGLNPQAEKQEDRLAGKTVVITGSLEKLSRDEAKWKIRRQGGKASSSVSGNTDYLVIGRNPGHNKTEAAREHGTKTLSEDEFLDLVGSLKDS
jgi:DNA ligase (NAD+)